MMKLTLNSSMNAIVFSENNIKEIEDRFNVSIRKFVSYKISDDGDRQHWENVSVGNYVCQRENESHINILDADRFQALVNEAVNVEPLPEKKILKGISSEDCPAEFNKIFAETDIKDLLA